METFRGEERGDKGEYKEGKSLDNAEEVGVMGKDVVNMEGGGGGGEGREVTTQ